MPGARALADDRQEIVQHRAAQRRVRHFRVELQTVHGKATMTDGSDRTGRVLASGTKSPATCATWSPVAHPHVGLSGHAREQLGLAEDFTAASAKFPSG